MLLPCFPDLILDQQELFSDLSDSMRVKVREALLKKHHHQNERRRNNLIPIVRSFAEVGKKQSDPHSMDRDGRCGSARFVFLGLASWTSRGQRLCRLDMLMGGEPGGCGTGPICPSALRKGVALGRASTLLMM